MSAESDEESFAPFRTRCLPVRLLWGGYADRLEVGRFRAPTPRRIALPIASIEPCHNRSARPDSRGADLACAKFDVESAHKCNHPSIEYFVRD
jgi:hypothetical protein